jgi:hypothetical protein
MAGVRTAGGDSPETPHLSQSPPNSKSVKPTPKLCFTTLLDDANWQNRGTGFVPGDDSEVTAEGTGCCEFRLGRRAANALQYDGSVCPDLASYGADLQRVISAWDGLSEAIRRAISALAGS